MNLGDSFTMAVPPNFDLPHLFFVITDPLKNSGVFHIVNITTNHIRAGKECVLNVGDHEWINQVSFVSFRDAREIDVKMSKAIDSLIGGKVKMHPPLKAAVIQKIIEAAKNSRSIPVEFKKFL
jgi:hypothetical protein